eukprot:15671770-Heterocapsa_arctica.AAC.1
MAIRDAKRGAGGDGAPRNAARPRPTTGLAVASVVQSCYLQPDDPGLGPATSGSGGRRLVRGPVRCQKQ